MSDSTNVDEPDLGSEGGGDPPPSDVSVPGPRDRPPLIEADPVEQAVEALAEVLPPGDRERTRRIVQKVMAWSAPLPPPDQLRELGEAAPGAVEAILADFERSSEVSAEIARHQMTVTDRELALLEREQDLRVRESESDMASRKWVQTAGVWLTVLMLLGAFLTLLFAPVRSDWARFWLVSLWFLPLLVFGAAVLLRGRYSENEREVMIRTLPRIAAAQRRTSRQRRERALPTPNESPSQPNPDE